MLTIYMLIASSTFNPISNAHPALPDARNYQYVSASADGKTLLITECLKIPSPRCIAYEHSLEGASPRALPTSKEDVLSAEYEGHAIVVTKYLERLNKSIVSRVNKNLTSVAEIFGVDGLVKAPQRTNRESYIYWKGTVSANGRMRYDLFERSLASGKENLFSNAHSFYSVGTVVQLNEESVLMNAEGPASITSIGDYWKIHNRSQVYILTRNGKNLSTPIYTDVEGARLPRASLDGTVLIVGEDNFGAHIFKYKAEKSSSGKYKIPNSIGAILFISNPTKNNMVYCIAQPNQQHRNKYIIIRLDLNNSRWESMSIPPISLR